MFFLMTILAIANSLNVEKRDAVSDLAKRVDALEQQNLGRRIDAVEQQNLGRRLDVLEKENLVRRVTALESKQG